MTDPTINEVILAALVERKNRLMHLDLTGEVKTPSRPTIRQRIEEVNRAIRVVQRESRLYR